MLVQEKNTQINLMQIPIHSLVDHQDTDNNRLEYLIPKACDSSKAS